MALTQFIKDLLYTSDRLVIPGFGSFVAQYAPAKIDKDNSLVYPPAKHFVFDDSAMDDDGVLIQYISRVKQISREEAKAAVNDMVFGFWKKLQDGSTLFIEDVGYFSLDTKNKIRFQKEDNKDLNSENYGLFPLAYHTPAYKKQELEDIELPSPKRISVVRILVIFLIINVVGAASALIYWKFNDIRSYFGKFASKKENPVIVPDTAKIQTSEDTTRLGQTIDTLTNIKNALHYEEQAKIDSSSRTPDSEASYYIIAASFQSYQKAEIQANIMKKQGFNPEIIEFSTQLFRISIGEYKTKAEALSQLEKFKSRKETEGAWLLLK